MKKQLAACFVGMVVLIGTVCVASAVDYTYDALQRLIRVDYGSGASIAYSYDAAGNRLTLVSQATPPSGDIFTYTTNNNTITINKYTGSDGAVTIPSTINGLPVTSLGANAFYSCSNVISVTIPASVTSIGDGAFSNCTSLTGVYFKGNTPSIGSTVFSGGNNATIYYLAGNTGWGTTFGGRPTALWKPQVQTKASVQAGPNMNIARMGHFIKELPDGRVVVFGGRGTGFVSLKSIEIWDPATNGFSLISAPYSFDFGALVRLADGRYLMAGGAADLGVAPGYNTAQIFDPNNNSVTSTGTTMTKRRTMCRGALLTNGKVLIAGGWYDNSSTTYGEIYDPASQAFTATGPLRTPRASPLVLPTADGRAVIAGGMGVYGTPSFLETVEIYDPAQNTFAVLSTNLFVGEAGWALRTDLDRPIEDFQTSDGGYVFLASRTTNSITEVALAIFDPATRQFTKRALQPTFTEKVVVWPAVVASGDNAAYFLSGYNTNGGANLFFRVQRVDLATGERTTSDELSITNYYPGSTAMTLLKDGRLFVTGGTTRVDSQYNFQPVKNTFMVSGLPGNAAQPTTASLEISFLPPGSVQISWPTSMVHYVLQAIPAFNAAQNWRSVTDQPSVVGDRFVLTLSALDATRYYRLYSLPQLSIQQTNGLLMLSWPKSATDFRLQMAVDLLPATQWLPVNDIPLIDNNRNVLIVTPTNPGRYYRLVSP